MAKLMVSENPVRLQIQVYAHHLIMCDTAPGMRGVRESQCCFGLVLFARINAASHRATQHHNAFRAPYGTDLVRSFRNAYDRNVLQYSCCVLFNPISDCWVSDTDTPYQRNTIIYHNHSCDLIQQTSHKSECSRDRESVKDGKLQPEITRMHTLIVVVSRAREAHVLGGLRRCWDRIAGR